MSFPAIKQALNEGLKLAKKSTILFFLYFLFNVLIYIHLTEYQKELHYALVYLPLYVAFIFTVPSLLDKIRADALTMKSMFANIASTLWRLVLPFGVFIFLILGPIVYLYDNNPSVLRTILLEVQKQQTELSIFDYVTSACLVSLFSFTTFFFSLEKRNIISATIRSISVTLQHPLYLFVLVSFSLVQVLIRNVFGFDTIYGNVLFAIPSTYLIILIASINLIYFRDTVQSQAGTKAHSTIPLLDWLQTSSSWRNMLTALLLLLVFYFLFYQHTGF